MDKPTAPTSQEYALIVTRAASDYWVKVHYLGDNPWTAVKDPVVVQEIDKIRVHRALSLEGWSAVAATMRPFVRAAVNHAQQANDMVRAYPSVAERDGRAAVGEAARYSDELTLGTAWIVSRCRSANPTVSVEIYCPDSSPAPCQPLKGLSAGTPIAKDYHR